MNLDLRHIRRRSDPVDVMGRGEVCPSPTRRPSTTTWLMIDRVIAASTALEPAT
jgi:hypothetical protein